MPSAEPGAGSPNRPAPALSLLDSTSIIVGIIIGSAIYRIAPQVARGATGIVLQAVGRSPDLTSTTAVDERWLTAMLLTAILGVWVIGGVVALIGALCYAELATAFPEVGGTYVYLSEALGRTVGFAFAWAEFWIVRPGNIGAVAFVLALYAGQLLPSGARDAPLASAALAGAAIVVLAALNAVGLKTGKRTQNVLTGCKVLGLLAIVAVGLTTAAPEAAQPQLSLQGSLGLAFIQIMFAYGGWADMSYVAAEVREPDRNIFRALLLGTGAVGLIYILVNIAFLHALGIGGVAASDAVAADVLSVTLGKFGSRAISLLVVISCLGAINGMLFTGARVFYALGTHHPIFGWLGAWNDTTGVPLRSLIMQALVTLGLVIACRDQAGFDRLVAFTAPFYWGFIALVGVALIILRSRGATRAATYRVPWYPVTPIIFFLTSGAMVYAGVSYALSQRWIEAWWAVVVVGAGVIVGGIDWRSRHR